MSNDIYLIKSQLNLGLFGDMVSRATSRCWESDTAHWALEVRGVHYHLASSTKRNKRLELSRTPIESHRMVFREEVGKTKFSDEGIQEASQEIISWLKNNYGTYDAFGTNCQAFANHLWHCINISKVEYDLMGLNIEELAGINYSVPYKLESSMRDHFECKTARAFSQGLLGGAFRGYGEGLDGLFGRCMSGSIAWVAAGTTIVFREIPSAYRGIVRQLGDFNG
ncbi:hypothetical protein D9756_002512 [Leucocoprinus leucothites]|uniref:PPPDE domain-containing protein n=1 Tax=Leucocoprinus leucothites TaxID=201217 RepID=A0A8H5LLC4_9AGAR|nr:hypothetical protein D9756_002512 [Leucoagaricus leucothites]